MNADEALSEELFAARLAAHDDALASGATAAGTTGPEVPVELRPRLEKDLAFLQFLQHLRPGRRAADSSAPHQPGTRLQHYELLEEIGRGGMGVVHRARLIQDGRLVALKRMAKGSDPVDVERFRREAENMRRLSHPHIVEVYAVGDRRGRPFFAMEFVEGGNLAQRAGGRPQPSAEAAALVAALARAIGYAHRQGIIHRDLKPANVVLTSDGRPKITDFGLAKLLDATTGLTPGGAVLGTPRYMAPEQAAGKTKEAGPLSDVYALGVILYELLTGTPPFQAPTLPELLQKIQKEPPPPLRWLAAGVDRNMDAVCLKCLEKNPRRRYRTADGLADDLERWLSGKRLRVRSVTARLGSFVRRHTRAAAALILLGVAAVAAATVAHYRDPDRPLKEITRQLAAGQRVVLLGEAGRPAWFRWATDDTEAKAVAGSDGTFYVQALKLGLLELLPDPQQERFRFQVEVRHDARSGADGQAGLYCLYSKHAISGSTPAHCFCGLSFSGLGVAPQWLGKHDNTVSLFTQARWPTRFRDLTAHEIDFPPAGTHFHPDGWKLLTVEVTPEMVHASAAGETVNDASVIREVGTLSRLALDKNARELTTGFEAVFDGMPDLQPAFTPRSAVGLYVYRGAASFRRAVIEPLAERQ